jgi:hypothetical protein
MREPYEANNGAQPLECVPNLDGKIEAGELREALGVPVSFLISPNGETRRVNVAGEEVDGGRVWDWSEDRADDQVLKLEAQSAEGRWYEGEVPAGAFVVPFDGGGQIETIYVRDEEALWIVGLASAEEEPDEGQTLLIYDEPVAFQRFPIEPGEDRIEVGEVRGGVLYGLPYAGRDVYELHVDAAGVLELPDLRFTQAMRLRQKVTVEPAVGQGTSRRQVSFLFECFGEVARAVSGDNEPEEDFTEAVEVRRLGLGL